MPLSQMARKQLVYLANSYLNKIPKLLTEIQNNWEATQPRWNSQYLHNLRTSLKKLQGGSASLGFLDIAAAAACLEELLAELANKHIRPNPEQQAQLVLAFKELAARCQEQFSVYLHKDESESLRLLIKHKKNTIFLLGDSPEIFALEEELRVRLFHALTFPNWEGLREILCETSCRALVAEFRTPQELQNIAQQIKKYSVQPALIFISEHDDLKTRLLAVRQGSYGYFSKPFEVEEVCEKINEIEPQDQQQPEKVLIIDDDVELSEYCSVILQQSQMEVEIISNPLEVLEPLKEFQPDVILLDINMPNCNGLELANIIRQSAEYADLPIIFFSTESHWKKISYEMELDVDDFLIKPIVPEELVLTVRKRVKKHRKNQKLEKRLEQREQEQKNYQKALAKIEQENQGLTQIYGDGQLQQGFILKGSEGENYEIERTLAQGGMGVTYIAKRKSDSKRVVIKTLLSKHINNTKILMRFLQEARTLLQCEHVNLVKACDLYQGKNFSYFVMDYIKGQSVGDILASYGRIDPIDASVVIRGVARALAYLEKKQVIHRDIKPENIIIGDDNKIKLVDFGIMKLADQSCSLTTDGYILGTPDYMSPEQVCGEPLDIRSDIYSLGATFYRMVTSKFPFRGESTLRNLRRRLTENPIAASEIDPEIPQIISEVICKMMEYDVTNRYQHAQELVADLDAILGKDFSW